MTDIASDTTTSARAVVGGSTQGDIESVLDQDWFAVELVAGRTYTMDLRGSRTNDGTLYDPFIRGIFDANGDWIRGTLNDNDGEGLNSHLVFTANESGTHYVAAGAAWYHLGTYTLEVLDTSADDARTGAIDLGDITDLQGPRFPRNVMDGDGDRVDYYQFTLHEAKTVNLGLRRLDMNADLILEDSEGNVLHSSTVAGTANEHLAPTLLSGTYFVRVESQEVGDNNYIFRYGVAPPDPAQMQALETAHGVSDVHTAPAFAEQSYAFNLAENTVGSASRVALGAVSATDPEDGELTYSIEGGNESGLFAIDDATGQLYYTGAGEDYEGGSASYVLTVRASDGGAHDDVAVTVNIVDVNEAPAFAETSYAFDLAEHADGRGERVALGAVSAADPEAGELTYSIEGGNESGLFAIDDATGQLYYTGAGEDYEGGSASYVLTVRASDGGAHDDVAVTVNIVDVNETPAFAETSYAFDLAEHADGREERVALGAVSATDPEAGELTYSIEGGNESGLFAIEDATGQLYYTGAGEDYEGGSASYVLTVRASDGGAHDDVAVTVNIVDVNEAPAFAKTSYAFELAENADGSEERVALGAVSATDPENGELTYSIEGGNESGLFAIDDATGQLYYTGAGEDYEDGSVSYVLTVRASDGGAHDDVAVTVNITDVDEAPAFAETSYAFDLAEHADGREERVALGAVSAADPEAGELTYSIEGGNESGLFAIDDATGQLYYTGAGEDYEGGSVSYVLTVRASDGGAHDDVAVTVNITDVDEAPAFAETSYAVDLAEHADGREERVALGAVSAADPEAGELTYSIEGGNESGLFAIDDATGQLYYTGAGEDYEGGSVSYVLTVRASDGGAHDDVAVTVNITDVDEAPAFAETSYAFDLAEHADGREERVALGAVSATDPENGELTYSIEGGNESGLFAIDDATGQLYYTGAGEDYEGGSASYVLTVRASEGGAHDDVAVTVNITDVDEAPAFAKTSYAFDLAENADGREERVALGAVSATDPENGELTYSIEGGNESGLFAIDEATGELYYTGAGEDYEGGNAAYVLTVRASDGSTHNDVSATVNLTDVDESGNVAEPVGGDLPGNIDTAGRIHVDGPPVSGDIATAWDRDWYAVEFQAGRQYMIGLRGRDTGDGTLLAPFLSGIRDSTGVWIPGTGTDSGGVGYNPRELFTATQDGTHYVSAGGLQSLSGTYKLSVRDVTDNLTSAFSAESYAFTLAEATTVPGGEILGGVAGELPDLGIPVEYRITGGNERQLFTIDPPTGVIRYVGGGEDYEDGPKSYELQVGAVLIGDEVLEDRMVTIEVTDVDESPVFAETEYAFDLTENADGGEERVRLGTVAAADPEGAEVTYSIAAGNEAGRFVIDAATGALYYTGPGEDYEGDIGSYALTVRASDGDLHSDVTVTVSITDVDDTPVFVNPSYAFDLAENSDGNEQPVALGTVSATDPWDRVLRYSIEDGNESRLFAINEATGELSYIGTGEDYEDGVASYVLTVRTRSGDVYTDVGVTVTVADRNDAPVFAEPEYAFDLAENTDGRETRVAIGTVSATDPDGTEPIYSIENGNESGQFSIDGATGELFYTGSGEDYESGTPPYDLTVRASDGGLSKDITVTVTVTDGNDAPIFSTPSYAFDLAEHADGSVNRVVLGSVSATDLEDEVVTYRIDGGNEANLFAIDEATGELSYAGAGEDYEATARYNLTVQASDGVRSSDVMVAVDITDVDEAPTFKAQKYAFYLDDQADGRVNPVALGAVSAADPENTALTYRIEAGNEAEKFEIDKTTGNLFYTAAGENRKSGTANYELTVRANDGDLHRDVTVAVAVVDVDSEGSTDFPANNTSPGRIQIGSSGRGDISFEGDQDWFAVELEAGKLYQFDMRGVWTDAGTLISPYLRGIYDASGSLLSGMNRYDWVRGGLGYFKPDSTDTYYLAAAGSPASFWSSRTGGTYTLSVREIVDDYPANIQTTGELEVGGSATGEVEPPGDRDWFAVTLEAGKMYQIDVEGSPTGAGTLYNPALHGIYNAEGVRYPYTSDDNHSYGNWNARLTFIAPEDGTYYLSAGDGDMAGDYYNGTYKVSVTEIIDDYSSDTQTTGVVTVGGSTTGKIDYMDNDFLRNVSADDHDWFAVELEADRWYQIDMEGSKTGAHTLYAPKLDGIYDADGIYVIGTTPQTHWGRNSRLIVKVTEDGTYYLDATAHEYADNDGTYKLSVTDVTDTIVDDHPGSTETTSAVAVGGSATGGIEYEGDRDWFAVTLEAGRSYQLDLEGSATGAGTLYDSYLSGVYEANGNLIPNTTNVDGGHKYNSRLVFTAPEDAIYYVSAGGNLNEEGTYRLSVTDVTSSFHDDYRADSYTTGRVEVGGSVTGWIDYIHDIDWHAVTLEADQTYRFTIDGKYLYPRIVGIYDENNDLMRTHDVGLYLKTRLEFTPTEDATYYVSVNDWGTRTHSYTLSADEVM